VTLFYIWLPVTETWLALSEGGTDQIGRARMFVSQGEAERVARLETDGGRVYSFEEAFKMLLEKEFPAKETGPTNMAVRALMRMAQCFAPFEHHSETRARLRSVCDRIQRFLSQF
jgi:hypothetical protein